MGLKLLKKLVIEMIKSLIKLQIRSKEVFE